MRIISGKYRGKALTPPKNDRVRPTTDRIKETVFNILQFRISDATVLDLFAGSGALGIECISRGAKEVVFVDKDGASLQILNANLKGIEGDYRVYAGDFLSALHSIHTKFDIIFIDPPYESNLGELAIEYIVGNGLLSESGVIYFEHGREKTYTPPKGYRTRTKPMGYTVAEFVERRTVAMATGSFDPITKGHMSVIEEAAERFDEVVVACLINPEKKYRFSPEERLALVRAATENLKNVRCVYSDKTAVETAKQEGAEVFVRGVRDGDLPYEEEMREYNLQLGIDTVFITPNTHGDVSSTVVKQQIDKGDFRNIPPSAILTLGEILNGK